MTSRDFAYWLQGFFEVREDKDNGLTAEQVHVIENHLSMVFVHEIDPSFPKKQQAALDAAHGRPPSSDKPVMRC